MVEVAPPTASDLDAEVRQDSLAVIAEGSLIQRRAGIIGRGTFPGIDDLSQRHLSAVSQRVDKPEIALQQYIYHSDMY
mgnify:CR=1 FL=1